MTKTNLEALSLLREWMHSKGIAAYVVPTADPHNNEYLPEHYKARQWLTGFTGSAGTAVVTADEALLWTDSRYWLQAEEQLGDGPFKLMKEGAEDVPSYVDWTINYIEEDFDEDFGNALQLPVVAFPPTMLSVRTAQELEDHEMQVLCCDVFEEIWENRPALPAMPIVEMPEECVGLTRKEKLQLIVEILDDECMDFVFNDLAEIAWALNLRGSDIPYNPVFLAYLLYKDDEFTLYTHQETMAPEIKAALKKDGVKVKDYEAIWKDIPEGESIFAVNEIAGDYDQLTALFMERVIRSEESPVSKMKARKNETEIRGFHEAMKRDGVAMVRFLHWLDEEMKAGREVTEMGVDRRLTALRSEQPGFRQLSFETIAGYAAHGAIVHYEATPETDVRLEPKSFLLLDSGAQYDCGTTDITRTIPLGPLTDEERRVYTLVLKGHLALQRLHFPKGATGLQLDTAARMDMWAAGYDFGHGTGHGVGHQLCVHEGPMQIRKDKRPCTLIPFEEGMVITNEPGIYVGGKFGVRIENCMVCLSSEETDFGRFLRFEPLTLCPYDLRAVDGTMLSAAEKAQINDYHEKVAQTLLPLLDEETDKQWLREACRPIA